MSDALKDISAVHRSPTKNGSSGNYHIHCRPATTAILFSTDPDSPYLITVNPKLDDPATWTTACLMDCMTCLVKQHPVPHRVKPTARIPIGTSFLGSSYFPDRLGLNPDRDYRFLGDAAFDTITSVTRF